VYLGIDFLIDRALRPWVVEVNVGLPGGAEEIDRIHRVRFGRPSGIFDRIEQTSIGVYRRPFSAYLGGLPFIAPLRAFKLWMDGRGAFPETWHPALRLEDKWVQYQILAGFVPMPGTMPVEKRRAAEGAAFLRRQGLAVLKRRAGRGGRGFKIIRGERSFAAAVSSRQPLILQEFVDSRIENRAFSVRALVFAGEFLGAYVNLAEGRTSNHGTVAAVEEGRPFGLGGALTKTVAFDEKSWEAGLWFGEADPPEMHRNLYEDEVADAALKLPPDLWGEIKETAVRIERSYERLDFDVLPPAFFEPSAPRGCRGS
jgi:hypothetical protein